MRRWSVYGSTRPAVSRASEAPLIRPCRGADAAPRCISRETSQAITDAIKATRLDTVVGSVDWTSKRADFPNVARTPLVGGQWRPGTTWPFELEIVSNATNPEIPATGTLQPIA